MKGFILLFVLVLVAIATGAPHRIRRSNYYDFEDLQSDLRKMDLDEGNLMADALIDTPANYHRAFNYAGFYDGKYIIFIPLPGYTSNEITVEAISKGIQVEAIHRQLRSKWDNYFEIFALPEGVLAEGSWEYGGGVLTLELTALPAITPTTPDITSMESKVTVGTPEDKSAEQEQPTSFSNSDFISVLSETTSVEPQTISFISETQMDTTPSYTTTTENKIVSTANPIYKEFEYEYYENEDSISPIFSTISYNPSPQEIIKKPIEEIDNGYPDSGNITYSEMEPEAQ